MFFMTVEKMSFKIPAILSRSLPPSSSDSSPSTSSKKRCIPLKVRVSNIYNAVFPLNEG